MNKPFLQSAIICERVLEEKDGTLSAIRLFDAVVNRSSGEFIYPVVALVIVRSNGFEGAIPVRVELSTPSGVSAPLQKAILQGRSQQTVMHMTPTFREAGLHWFNVYIGGELATKIPLTVIMTGDKASGMGVSDYIKGELSS